MAYFKSNIVKRETVTAPDRANEPHELLIAYTVSVALVAADVVELWALPAGAKFVGASLLTENMTAGAINVGLMSGDYGVPDGARTVGTQLFSAVAGNAPHEASLATLAAIAPDESKHRGIGVQFAVNQAAAANKRLLLRVRYTM